jgi:hypothetical protein
MNNVAALTDEPSSQRAWSATPVVFVVDADASARESQERQWADRRLQMENL